MAQERAAPDSSDDPRVYFAAERTLLAWVRTGLALMGFGFVVARFGLFLRELAAVPGVSPQPHSGLSLWMGTTLVVLGVAVNLSAAVKHWYVTRQLDARSALTVYAGVSGNSRGDRPRLIGIANGRLFALRVRPFRG